MMNRLVKTLGWWSLFVTATIALAQVFEQSRALTGELPEGSVLQFATWLAVLVLSLVLLGYEAYAKSRQDGTVVHRLWFYDVIYERVQAKEAKTP